MSDLAPALRESIGIVAHNRRLLKLVETLQVELAHSRIEIARLKARVNSNFDIDCDSPFLPAPFRRQAD